MALTDNLELYAKYDDDLTDASGNGRNGTGVNSPTYAAGRINNGASFAGGGLDQHVTHGTSVGIDNVSAMSWSVWVKPSALSDYRFIVMKGNSSATSRTCLGLGGSGAGSSTGLLCTVANGGNDYGYSAGSKLATNTLAHLVMVFDGTQTGNANRLKLYINGTNETLTFSGTIPATTANRSSDPLAVGILYQTFPDYEWQGIIDELGVWSRALTSGEVTSLWNSGSGLAYPFSSSSILPFTTRQIMNLRGYR